MSATTTEQLKKPIPFRTGYGRRARGQCEPVVFWVRADGDMMLAPHTLMPCFPGYQKIECTTPSDIERMSRKMATQEENKLRGLKIEEMVRALPKWEQIISNCKLRLAAGCISNADEALTKSTLASMERKRARLIEIMVGNATMSENSLVIEQKEAPIGMAASAAKKVVVE